ncbi:agmatine deiminase family protein [Hydrogenimonas urashimensis]|uniref:agmatine deiminase family protein n=1 Tax=Hydrogenimonas urashimensis TaxID=2740515 RepID=UPI001914DE8C|nr:agmatine deiminase family protein [Hydrogenimonas urashimensis]
MCIFPTEWQKQDAVLMALPHEGTDWAGDLKSALTPFIRIASAIAYSEPVLLLCRDAKAAGHYFCDTRNITFIEIETNDTWTRDYGPITLYENGIRKFLDFTFNGWGNKFESTLDNAVTRTLVERGYLYGDYEKVDFVLEGGSIECDGKGTLLTTSRCLLNPNRNPGMDRQKIESFLTKKLCLQRVLWLDHGELLGDDTDAHIDTLARFIDEETIAYVTCDDPADPHYENLKMMEAQLREFRTLKGKPYHLVPLPLPSPKHDRDGNRLPATYANFLVTNHALLLPTYDDPKDKAMIALFKTLYPHREVIPINCLKLIEQGGSLHCSTMQIPAYYFSE